MRRRVALLALASGVVSSGCLGGFRHPLGPVEEAFVEEGLVGQWSCTSAADPAPARLTLVDFDGRQYYIESVEQGTGAPVRLRGHATRVEAASFLSIRDTGRSDRPDWEVLRYDIPDSNHLVLRLVAAAPFEDVIDDPDRVRERLAGRLDAPEVVSPAAITCLRPGDAR